MKKTRLDMIEEEIDECANILTGLIIERDVSLYLNETNSLQEIQLQIKAIQNRSKALKYILEDVKNPYAEFLCVLAINKEN